MGTPMMFSCPLPDSFALTDPVVAVSIADKPCANPAWNALTVFNGDKVGRDAAAIKARKAGKVAYCVKGLAFPFK